MKSKYWSMLAIILWFSGLILVSCNTSSTVAVHKPDATSTPQARLEDLTPQSKQDIPTVTTLPALTSIDTVAPISTLLPTVTPSLLPTLSPIETADIIFDLYTNNGGCQFPCFWGFRPGQTKWETVEQSVTPFAYQIYPGHSESSEEELLVAEVIVILSQVSSVPISHLYGVKDGIITALEVPLLSVSNNTVPAILGTYGQPNEIWLLTASAPMDDVLGFSLTLFYAEHNFMLEYSNWNGEIIDRRVHGCLSGGESLRLVAWSPEEELTFAEVVDGLHKPRPIIYDLPLEEATGISVESFYETFKNTNEPICLETPTELWPGP